MKRSKHAFYVVTAIVVAAVILVFLFWPGEGITQPPATDPTGEETPATTDAITEPSEEVFPTIGETVPLYPTEPAETSPQQGFRPDEETAVELPLSNGANYYNLWPVSLNVHYYLSDQLFEVSFGRSEEGRGNYIYLSPSVELVSGNGEIGKNFQFVFTSSAGYVTTITDAELGDYTTSGYSTFVRAQDYGLPSVYESESCPGTVWYMSEDSVNSGYIYIDVRVYYSGRLLASLRIYVMQDISGAYYMVGITNLNQLEADTFYMMARYEMSEDHLTALMDLTASYAYDAAAQHKYSGSKEFAEEDFVIEWRADGQGPYFDYISDLASDLNLSPGELYSDTPIVAVSIRDNGKTYHPAPLTYYYRILEGAGENGETVYELLGVDSADHYYLRGLYYCSYPGYSDT